jgi:hypothetical protein
MVGLKEEEEGEMHSEITTGNYTAQSRTRCRRAGKGDGDEIEP